MTDISVILTTDHFNEAVLYVFTLVTRIQRPAAHNALIVPPSSYLIASFSLTPGKLDSFLLPSSSFSLISSLLVRRMMPFWQKQNLNYGVSPSLDVCCFEGTGLFHSLHKSSNWTLQK